jgi:DnaJ-class molecular chaperone
MSEKEICHHCIGRGIVDCACNNPKRPEPCDRCHGTGTFTCRTCKGSGYLQDGRPAKREDAR